MLGQAFPLVLCCPLFKIQNSKFKIHVHNHLLSAFINVEDYSILYKAKNNFKNNIKILKEIVQISFQDLDEYFQNVKIYSLNCEIKKNIQADFHLSLKVKNDKPLTEIIECQVVDNLFLANQIQDPMLMMSEINNLSFGEYNFQCKPVIRNCSQGVTNLPTTTHGQSQLNQIYKQTIIQ